jgi:uncharacterized protein YneR
MQVIISEQALEWFKKELEVTSGDHVQFFARYGGCGNFQSGFSLGVTVKAPEEEAASVEKDGILFYVEKKDEWYFDGKDLKVTYDEEKQEVSYNYAD